ncbi:rve multi-domain protein [Pyrenophora tritici-repentis]|uniref:Rve multi-domain protein n=1 Tax=Pyrenophora tritici-repentis TaxID=45151 RepID=A0A922NG46_9PLEO|nr:rve multi-domain protein [Pyrenophora tritici-repentis]
MFRTINAISDNVSTGGRHPRRSRDMQPPPQPSVTDFPIGRKKRKDKAPATPRSQDSSRERPKDTASDTQQTISQGPAPKHEPVRRSEPGRRSTFGYPALPVTEGDSQEPTMVPHDPADIYDVIVGSCRLQSLRNKNVLSAKITHSEFTFITIVQNETEDEFELYLGRESPLEEFQVPVCTDDDLLELATSNTAFLRSLAIELMKFAAACAPILDANIDAITKEAHEAAVNRLRLRITKAEAKLSWYEKEVSKLTETIETTNAELEHTNRERNELKLEVERFYRPSSSKTAGCTNPTHQDWYEDWKHEEAQSIKFHGLYEEFFRKHQEERARADRYHQQRAERDADYEDVVAQNCALEEQLVQATENTRKLETSLTQQQRDAMIGYARAFLRPGLAAAASHAFDDEQENALVKFLDAARKSDLTQKQINQGKTAADKPRTKPRTRSPNDRNPARKARSGRGQHREATTTRTEWQKDAMAKAKVCFRCGETGHQARDKKGCAILDWDQIKPKLSSMHLYAMGADFDAEDDDSNASTEEEPELDDMGEPELDWRKDIQQNRETRENHNRLKVAAARILSPEVGDQDNSQDVQDHYISAIAVKGHLRSTKQLRYDSYTLTSSKEWKKTTTLIDTGASASFVNRRWAKAMGLPIMSTSSPIQLSLADGKVVDTLNEAVEIQVKHGSHLSPVVCFVADVGDFDLILGMTWLEDHDPGLTFSPRSMKFSSSHCTSCCLDHGLPETVYGDGKTPSLSESRQTTPVGEICIITAKAAYLMAAHNPDEAIWVEPQDWEKLADPPDDNNDCDLDSFKRNIARLAAVTQEDYDHYMNKMESPHMTEAEIRKLVPDWLYSKMPDLFTRVCTINIAKDGGSRHAVYLANLITQRTLPDSIPAVAQMLYQLSEEDNISERYAVLAALPGIEPEGGENGVSHDLTSKRSLCAADNVTISPITTPIAATSAPAIPNETPAAINVPAPPNNELTIDALLDNIKAAYKDDKVLQAIVKAKKDGLRRLPFKLIHGEEHLRLELGDCEITDELLYVRNKVYVPAGAVRTQVIEQAHKSVCGGHSGKHELYSKLSRWYYWPRMTTDVAQYVRACLTCKRSKAYREGKHGLLHPLPIPSKYWSSISIDFITHLPPCRHNGQTFTDILVVVDRLTKKKKFIPMASMTTDALVVAFIEYIWREEGFPEEIISDRGAQFVSYFWKRLCQRLGVRPKFSTAHHPQTDGQTENANSYLKQYLRAYVNYEQDNWALFLPIAEFEANSSTSSTTGKSPFFATKGYNPRSGIEPPAPAPGAATLTAPAQQERLNADAFADRMKTLQDELRASMQWAQAKQAEYANEGRLPAPAFKVGDQVMLDTRNLRTKRPSASLDLKNRGPFTIVRAINNTAYELDLPANMKRIHNVFHPWLLHLVDDNPLTGQTQDPEVPAEFDPEVEDDTEYTVEAIEDCRINKKLKDPAARGRKGKTTQGLLQYLVRWANYPDGPDNPSWEPYMNLADSADTVTRYHLDHPNKPPMHRKFKSLTGKQDMLVMRLHALSRV